MTIKYWGVASEKPEDILYENAIQQLIDATAKQKGFDDANSLASYYNSSFEAWRLESRVFVEWRDSVWLYYFTELDKMKHNKREFTEIFKFLDELPKISWPTA